MKFKALCLITVALFVLSNNCFSTEVYSVKSPDKKISVEFWLTKAGEPMYSVSHSGSVILKPSKLGVSRSDGNFYSNLTLDSVSVETSVSDQYTLLHGKRLNCTYIGNKKIFYLRNSASQKMEIIFQVSNDGVAFRYYFPEKTDKPVKIYKELSSFHFDLSTKAFLQHCPDARTGWCFTQPSYEEYYQLEIPVGTVSPNQAGWVMPALFNFGKYWFSITETAVDTNY